MSNDAKLDAIRGRGHPLGFAQRTRKNLDYMAMAYETDGQPHLVTQIVNSLLGLVVFPWERKVVISMEKLSMEKLYEEGWPRWDVVAGECSTLGDLIFFLRNSAAHGAIAFSSDAREPKAVAITVTNHRRPGKRGKNDREFVGLMSADKLLDFCKLFSLEVERRLEEAASHS